MTEKQAWWECAVAYATPRDERTEKQKRLVYDGICVAMFRLTLQKLLSTTIYFRIKQKIKESMPPDTFTYAIFLYFCEPSPANDLLRADYCFAMYYSNGAK